MKRILKLSTVGFFTAALVASGPSALRAADSDPVVVTVRTTVAVPEGPVLVGYVATLRGGDLALRERIARLDVADPPGKGGPLLLLRELIAYRIQIAGIERNRFRMEGPQQVTIQGAAQGPTKVDPPENPVLIKAREVVTLNARVGGVRLVARGEALQDGRSGERIRLRNIDSKKEVIGRVRERGVVEVDF